MKKSSDQFSGFIRSLTVLGMAANFIFLFPLTSTPETVSLLPVFSYEPDADDVPFDTREVTMDYYYHCATEKVVLNPEKDATDFPFNTECIASHHTEYDKINNPFTNPECLLDLELALTVLSPNAEQVALASPACNSDGANEGLTPDTAAVDEHSSGLDRTGKVVVDKLSQVLPVKKIGGVFKTGLISVLVLISVAMGAFLFFTYAS